MPLSTPRPGVISAVVAACLGCGPGSDAVVTDEIADESTTEGESSETNTSVESTTGETGEEDTSTTSSEPIETLHHVFVEYEGPLKNPDMGWVIYAFDPAAPESIDLYSHASILYTNYITWADLEPVDDAFDWTLIEGLVEVARAHGLGLHLALNSVDPTSIPRVQIPYWFIAEHPDDGRWVTSWYGQPIHPSFDFYGQPGFIFEPDYAAASYQAEYTELLQALGDRIAARNAYVGEDPWATTIHRIEHSHYGYWGEWHSEFPWPSDAVKLATLTTMVGWNQTYFPDQPGEISALVADPNNAVLTAVAAGAGLVRKCIGICDYGYLSPTERATIDSLRDTTPFRGEWGSWTGALDAFYASPTDVVPVNDTRGAIDEALALRVDALGWYGNVLAAGVTDTGETLADYFQTRAGYRFYLESLSHPSAVERGELLTVDLVWHQRAVSKLYRSHDLSLMLRDERSGDLHVLPPQPWDAYTWVQGPTPPVPGQIGVMVPEHLEPGVYQLYFAVVDASGAPAIDLAITADKLEPGIDASYFAIGPIELR